MKEISFASRRRPANPAEDWNRGAGGSQTGHGGRSLGDGPRAQAVDGPRQPVSSGSAPWLQVRTLSRSAVSGGAAAPWASADRSPSGRRQTRTLAWAQRRPLSRQVTLRSVVGKRDVPRWRGSVFRVWLCPPHTKPRGWHGLLCGSQATVTPSPWSRAQSRRGGAGTGLGVKAERRPHRR